MADIPPDFEIPEARPRRPPRPALVSFAGWVFVAAGAITGIGGLFYLASGAVASEALAYAAFGLAEAVIGVQVLRLSASFRLIAMPVAAVGILLDIAGITQGNRWGIVAIVLHAIALFGLAANGDAFGPR
jgi:hypothetical protein